MLTKVLPAVLQVFIPLLTPHVQVTSSTGEVDQSRLMLGSYELLRQVVLRQASLTGEDVEYGRGQQLQQRGIALTFGRHTGFGHLMCIGHTYDCIQSFSIKLWGAVAWSAAATSVALYQGHCSAYMSTVADFFS